MIWMPFIGVTSFEQTRAEQIASQLEFGYLEIDADEATRSPSPPPVYDVNGQRTNTREVGHSTIIVSFHFTINTC